MYSRRKSKISKIALIVSAIIHICGFFVFAMVKFRDDAALAGSKMAVTFVKEQQTKVLRRSLFIRPTDSIKQSQSLQRDIGQKAETRVNYKATSDFYVENSPRVFSQVRSVGQRAMQIGSIQKPNVNVLRGNVREMSVDVRNTDSRISQSQLNVSSGAQLFDKGSLTLAKPEIKVAVDSKNLLQKFLKSVRKKIEESKTYPPAARDSGLEGSSGVKMTINKDGQLEKVEIIDSSGHEILDNAAIQSVRNASPFPPIPEEIGRERIEMNLYVVFKIT